MKQIFNFEAQPFEAYSEFDGRFGAFDTELADETAGSALATIAGMPAAVLDALRRGLEPLAIRLAVLWGYGNVDKLTNLVFFARHPEREGRKLLRGEPGFERLSKEWLDIRDRLVRPAIAPPATTVPPVTAPAPAARPPSTLGGGGRCPDSPLQWAREKLPKMIRWWRDKDQRRGELRDVPVGTTLREMTSKVFPGVPVEAIIGFCANGNVTENTTEGVPAQRFHEIGLFGTEAGPRNGPAPNPDPNAPNNSWGKLANDPTVKKLLGGRAATMEHNRWKTAIPDQVAVGLVNLRRHGARVAAAVDPSIRPDAATSSSPFFVACCFMGWSAGDGRAARHLNQFKTILAGVPEGQRWGAFLRALADGITSGRINLHGLRKHFSVAYSAQRTWQKLAAGQLLAGETGGAVGWFDTGLGSDESLVMETITCAGNAARRPARRP